MSWQPTIGRWNDEENFDLKEPMWRRLLKLAAQHGDIQELQSVLMWLSSKNMHGDFFRIYVIGSYLHASGVDITAEVSDSIYSDIQNLSEQGATLDECTVRVMRKMRVAEEWITAFKERH